MAVHGDPMQTPLLAEKQRRSSQGYSTILYTRFIQKRLNSRYLLTSPMCSLQWPLLSSAATAELYHGLKRINFISPEEKNCLLYLSHTSLISSHCSCPLNMQRGPRKDYLQHRQQDHLQDLIAPLISVDLKEPTQTVQILTTHLRAPS